MLRLSTYWHTLRHLRPVQFYGRARLRLSPARLELRPPPEIRPAPTKWERPARRRQSVMGPDSFCFLNETHSVALGGWDNAGLEKLWRYNLHYFDDLNAADARSRAEWHQSLLLRWVQENEQGVGTGWEPYPTSLRIVNWIKWVLGGNQLPSECVVSLAVQIRWLARRLEFHLLANHLFANAKALVFAGLFFRGAEADAWFERGMRILEREVDEQILEDGGQFERSPMYHSLALEDMLDLVNLFSAFAASVPDTWTSRIAQWRARTGPMRAWLQALCHPDGEIAYFNDAAIGISPPPAEIEAYATRLRLPFLTPQNQGLFWLRDSGYVRVEASHAVALLDVGPIGPDYMPGHAHADTLSFEVSLFGQRLFVNSGTSCYGSSAERLRQRGTAAHNTVTVDGENSSEIWGGFRVARRARPIGLTAVEDNSIRITCSHDGYRRLRGRPKHTRQWNFAGSELLITDVVSGRFSSAEARFHLHPAVSLEGDEAQTAGTGEVILRLPGGQRILFAVKGARLRYEPTSWHPEFGSSEPNVCLVATLTGSSMSARIFWESAL